MSTATAEPSTARESEINNESFSWRKAWSQFPFLSLCWASYFLIAAIGILIFYVVLGAILHYFNEPLSTLAQTFKYTAWILIAFPLFFIGSGLSLITITALTGLDLLYPHGKDSITVRYLFPIAVFLGQIFGIDRNRLRVSFVKVNNAMTIAQRKRITGDRILILLPHCLQIDKCNRKITNNVQNCVRCGKCSVAKFLELGDKYGLTIEVVNGGTLARRKVKTFQPDGIVAIACERDLTLGILDVHPVPVYGVINDRPNGPCYNTEADLDLAEKAIRFFTEKKA